MLTFLFLILSASTMAGATYAVKYVTYTFLNTFEEEWFLDEDKNIAKYIQCEILMNVLLDVFAQMSEECQAMPRPKVKPMECCRINKLMDHDSWQKCNTGDNSCIGDCVLKMNNLINEDVLDIEAIKAFGKKQLSEAEWAPIIDATVTNCSTAVAEFPLEHNCKTHSEPLMMCIHHGLSRNCPDSIWSKDEKCTELRSFMQKCPRPFRRPTPRPN